MTHNIRKHTINIIILITTILLCLSGPAAIMAAESDYTRDTTAGESLSVDPTDSGEGYMAVLYDNTNGLPTSEANDIAQTGEGFLWIGSYSGLIRYDGNDFERFDSTRGITSVKSLYVDSLDRLWIGTNDSGVVLLEKGSMKTWGENEGLRSSSVRGIAEDDGGIIYISTTDGLAMLDHDLNLFFTGDDRLDSAFLDKLECGPEGMIYGTTNDGDIFTVRDGRLIGFTEAADNPSGKVGCVFPDPVNPGYIYTEAGDGIVCYSRLSGNEITPAGSIDIAPLSQVSSFNYIDGKYWICARNGVGVIEDGRFVSLDNLPMNNSICCVRTDYEGNLWFASSRQGVMKIVPNRFTDISRRYELKEDVVNSTCLYRDRLFVGTDTGLVVTDKGGRVDSLPLTGAVTAGGRKIETDDLLDFLDGCRIRSIIRDSRDRLWISTWRQYGLIRYDGRSITVFDDDSGLYSNNVRAIWEMKDGRIIVADTGGVVVIGEDGAETGYGEAEGIENTEILTVTEGENGDIICGTDGGGIYILGDSGIRRISRREGLKSEAVMRVKPDRKHNIYWVITGSSISYLTRDYQLRNIENFPYSNNFDIYENSKGDVWVLSSNGIYVCSYDLLLEDGEIDPFYFGMSNGLPCITTANSYSELDDNGDLYISGTSGVAKVNIESDDDNVSSIKAAVPYIEADGERIFADEEGTFRISSGIRKVTIYGFVFNYSLVDPAISYYLDGFDTQETMVKRADMAPVDYTNLRGGSYRFVMKLYDSVSKHTETVSVRIEKEKAFYEYPWFYILCGFLIIGWAVVIMGAYVQTKVKEAEKKSKEAAEKERINNELKTANEIQLGVLPGTFPAFPDRHEFDIYATMQPAREVGGDFYDFFLIDEDHLGLVMADVSGKGVPAALFMMIAKNVIQSCAMVGSSPAEILTRTNDVLCSNNKMEMFVTVWVGILEISTGRLIAANAGHEYPAIKRADGVFELYRDKHGFVVGGYEGIKYSQYELKLDRGDKLFLYTDGVPEAIDLDIELFGTERMLKALNVDHNAGPEVLLKYVRDGVEEFSQGLEQFDDLTMMCLQYKGT